MYNESKSTYIIIAGLIVVLAFVAYFLQGDTTAPDAKQAQTSEMLSLIQNKTGGTQQTATSTKKADTQQTIISSTTTLTTNTMTTAQNITGAVLKTNMGDIEFTFATTAPHTVQNFVTLATTKFYDGVRFHRVIKDFMIQVGDPLSKDITKKDIWGTGGPGYKFDDELSGKEQYTQGTIAMANAGPNTNGSQFFIVTASPLSPLPPSYTVFGHVTKGLDVALKIQDMQTDNRDRPVQDIIVKSVEVK